MYEILKKVITSKRYELTDERGSNALPTLLIP